LLEDNIGHPIGKLVIEMKGSRVEEFVKKRYGEIVQTARAQKAYERSGHYE